MGIFVMTGGTSGLGAVAARHLHDRGHTLLLGARATDGALRVDLTSLREVREFAGRVEQRLGGRRIDGILLNAGGYGHGATCDGYEATFVLNYLAHFVLLQSLWPHLRDGARLVLTTSGTHDPAEASLVPAPRHANARWLARPELDLEVDRDARRAAMHAYAAAKLCVVMYARGLAAAPDTVRRGIEVIAYDPGPTPGTGLARGLPAPVRILWTRFPGLLRAFMRKANTAQQAGAALAELALGVHARPPASTYATLRRGALTWREPSELARRDELVAQLVRDSEQLAAAALCAPLSAALPAV